MIQRVRGFKDVLPPESDIFYQIEKTARETFETYNFKEIRLPTVEYFDLFVKSTGEETDIVKKEMYKFEDNSKRVLALRPEGTPGTVRAFIENNLNLKGNSHKYFYIGNMFRAERPQAQRYREFEQIGVEYIGNPSPYADAEIIILLDSILKKLNLNNLYRIEINSLGCQACRKKYKELIVSELKKLDLCQDCNQRISKNPLRVLDCKIDQDKFKNIPPIELCDECLTHHNLLKEALNANNITFIENKLLVRGIDYYTKTVFEFKMSSQSSQDAIAGGGRYDNLVKLMGGVNSPSVGWAMGVERVVSLMISKGYKENDNNLVFVVSLSSKQSKFCFKIINLLRNAGIKTDFSNFENSLKSQMRDANSNSARYAIIIGEDEEKTSKLTIKRLSDGKQQKMEINEIINKIKNGELIL
ncbi:MAG: histidine--tRNA ligase [Elusimicrobiota bacterium]